MSYWCILLLGYWREFPTPMILYNGREKEPEGRTGLRVQDWTYRREEAYGTAEVLRRRVSWDPGSRSRWGMGPVERGLWGWVGEGVESRGGGKSHCCCSVTQSCPILCDPINYSKPGLPVHHQLLELAQSHAHWIGGAIQPSHPLLFPSPPAFNLSQHQHLLQWVKSLDQVAKVLEFQLQHQSFQWLFSTDFL